MLLWHISVFLIWIRCTFPIVFTATTQNKILFSSIKRVDMTHYWITIKSIMYVQLVSFQNSFKVDHCCIAYHVFCLCIAKYNITSSSYRHVILNCLQRSDWLYFSFLLIFTLSFDAKRCIFFATTKIRNATTHLRKFQETFKRCCRFKNSKKLIALSTNGPFQNLSFENCAPKVFFQW